MSKRNKKKYQKEKELIKSLARLYSAQQDSEKQSLQNDLGCLYVYDTQKADTCVNQLDEAVAREKRAREFYAYTQEMVGPIALFQLRERKKDRKFQKKCCKHIQQIEQKITDIEHEQECLRHALAFVASTMSNATPDSSAAELEKVFKRAYKKWKKSQSNLPWSNSKR